MTPPSSHPRPATIADLRAFLTEFGDLDVMPAPQARAFAGNVSRLLDDVGVLDTDVLADLSIPDLADLYAQAQPRLTTATRGTYLNQLTRAIAMVTARAADDPLWALTDRRRKPARQTPSRRAAPARTASTTNAKAKPANRAKPAAGPPTAPMSAAATGQPTALAPAVDHTPPATSQMITYPFPLRGGQRAELTLPESLTTADATRLTAFITALAIEPDQPTS